MKKQSIQKISLFIIEYSTGKDAWCSELGVWMKHVSERNNLELQVQF